MEPVIGIDLGTTNSLAAQVTPKGLEMLENETITSHVPSVVAILPDRTVVGQEALLLREDYPKTTFYSFKRFMGRGAKDVATELENLPYQVRASERDHLCLGCQESCKSPEELSALVLKEVKTRSEQILGQAIKKAVITVPAYFDDGQRQATRMAAELAGIEVMRILNEPTAAALAYGLGEKEDGKILVYDFGGGTFDVSILEIKNKLFKVLATHGNTHLGGDDLDQALMNWAKAQIPHELDSRGLQTLKSKAEALKIALTNQLEATETLQLQGQEPIHLHLTRQELDQLIHPFVEETLTHIKLALQAADLRPEEIGDVVMVGGSSRIPLVRARVREFFGKPLHLRLNPDQVVALGAARQAHLLAGGSRDFLLMDVVPLSLGIETLGGTFNKMIIKNASIPARVTEEFSTSVDNQTGITLNIFQGEREFVADCRKLGQFILKGIPPMPAGLPRVKVTFFVDANGLLKVSAREERSGVEAEIEIIPTHGLKQAEVSNMIRASMEHAMEDFEQRTLVEFRAKLNLIDAGMAKIWDQAKALRSPEELALIQAQLDKIKSLAQSTNNPMELKAELDQMGNLTRDLADQIMGEAARQALLDTKTLP